MSPARGAPVLIVAAAFFLAGCPAPEDRPEDLPPVPSVEPGVALPDTTAESLWAYLQEADYRQWQLWPTTMRFYEGTEPHGALLTTYLNERAHGALAGGVGPLPHGSIIVKESYDQDSTLVDITVMYAAEDYNPRHNDWFWAKYGPMGRVDVAGRVEMCQDCHQVASRGHLMTEAELLEPEEDPEDVWP